jgi:signal peptidase I
MLAALLVAAIMLVVGPIIGFLIFAGSLLLAVRRAELKHIRFRSALWITLVLALADLSLTAIFRTIGLTGPLWNMCGLVLLFPVFLPLLRSYQPISVRKGARVYASTILVALVGSVAVIVGLVVPLRLMVASPFAVRGESMTPTYRPNDIVFVNKLTYRTRSPKRGEIVVLEEPAASGMYYVKRIIGLPGETVIIANHTVAIASMANMAGKILQEPYIQESESASFSASTSTFVPPDHYFVLGDNRDRSSDSRYWGPIPQNHIVGVVAVKVWPPS